ncbi:MAG: hypothetical protein ACYDFQ_08350 [Vulcanimicrobiaceae bacterium]
MPQMPRFLCIDDAPPGSDNIVGRLLDAGMQIEHKTPIELEPQLRVIRDGKYDGLILDLVLSEHVNNGVQVGYRSNALARLVRDEAVDQLMLDIPIALWSSNDKFQRFYQNDFSGQELYDIRYEKDFVVREPSRVMTELLSLSHAYEVIENLRAREREGFCEMLGLHGDASKMLDSRIGLQFFGVGGQPPATHEFARFIEQELIREPYPLVDEALLSARLGVDIGGSTDWAAVLDSLGPAAYGGVLKEAWPRWWWGAVESIARTWCGGDFRFLRPTSAFYVSRNLLGLPTSRKLLR